MQRLHIESKNAVGQDINVSQYTANLIPRNYLGHRFCNVLCWYHLSKSSDDANM